MKIDMLRTYFAKFGRIAVTLIFVTLAVFSGKKIWLYYQVEPWTPDGRVRADIVQIAPDVSGLVTHLDVVNDQQVKRGQLLFQIDPERYALAVRETDAALLARRIKLAQAKREANRNKVLGELVPKESREQAVSKVAEAETALAQALVNRDLAVLNLQRTRVLAPM